MFFEAFPIKSINEFKDLILANPALKGLGVTIPYKEQVLPFVDEMSEEVKCIGATNSIKISGNKLIAYNTDIDGFEQSFVELLKPAHTKALVLGTGGASKAVRYVLNKLGIPFLVVSRNEVLQDRFITYSSIDEKIINDYKVIINCTPVGMHPNENAAPEIPYHLLTNEHYLYDLVYKPVQTLFLQKEQQRAPLQKMATTCC